MTTQKKFKTSDWRRWRQRAEAIALAKNIVDRGLDSLIDDLKIHHEKSEAAFEELFHADNEKDPEKLSELIDQFEKEHVPHVTKLLEAARNPQAIDDTLTFDCLVSLSASLLREDSRLPIPFAMFVADVLEQNIKRPTKRGAEASRNFRRNYLWGKAMREVAKQFGLQLYSNNELSEKPTAAQIVSEAIGQKEATVISAYKTILRQMGAK